MAINKVQYGSTTLIDLSTDTVSSSADILLGKVGHLRDGTVVTGTASGGDQHGTIWQDSEGYVHLDDESGISLQTKTATPSESSQVIEPDEGYYALESVTVGAISSSYVGSGVTRRSSSDLSVSGATVTAPAGYYEASASKSVASGTAGTPTATKSAVSNHAVTVTPSVTNTTGYITGSTKTGTAVTVSASELVSGSQTVTSNQTVDVTNLAELVVNVDSSTDFVVTFTKNQSGDLVPDCTYAEVLAAYNAGKTIAAVENTDENPIRIDPLVLGDLFNGFLLSYFVYFYEDISQSYYNDGTITKFYTWSSNGIQQSGSETTYYSAGLTDAVPSDVASGKVFINSQGVQIGTASSGGSSNLVQGEFTTSATGGVTQLVSIPYNGNGYPIAITIEPAGGWYSNESSAFYNLIQRYVTVNYCAIKTDMNTAPTYVANGGTSNQNGAEVMYMYKNSTSNALITAVKSGSPTLYSGEETTYANESQVTLKNSTTMYIFVASSSYGFAPATKYTYQIVYSE